MWRCRKDVVQEAFLKLSTVRPSPDNSAAWLYVWYAYAASVKGVLSEGEHSMKIGIARSILIGSSTIRTRIDADAAVTAMQTLPLRSEKVMIAHLWGGLTFEEIGQIAVHLVEFCHRLYAKRAGTVANLVRRSPCSLIHRMNLSQVCDN